MALGDDDDDDVIGGDDSPAEVPVFPVAADDAAASSGGAAHPDPDVRPGTPAYFGVGRYVRGIHVPRRPPLGRPRVSTMVLMSVWVAVLALYLVVRPG
jgi:hypothetical protein